MQYTRKEDDFAGGTYRLKGEILDIFPPYDDFGIRVEFFDNEVESIKSFEILNKTTIEKFDKITSYPAKEFITSEKKL